jgi:hypothetical protein
MTCSCHPPQPARIGKPVFDEAWRRALTYLEYPLGWRGIALMFLVGCSFSAPVPAAPTMDQAFPLLVERAIDTWPLCDPTDVPYHLVDDPQFFNRLGAVRPETGGFNWIVGGELQGIWLSTRVPVDARPYVAAHELGHACAILTGRDADGDHDHVDMPIWEVFVPGLYP